MAADDSFNEETGRVESEDRGVPVTVVQRMGSKAALLPCVFNVETTPSPRVEWKKIKGKHVTFMYFDHGLTDAYKNRAKMNGYSIRLLRVTREDMATYRCEVTARDDRIVFAEKEFKLSVLVPPVVPTCKVPSSAISGSKVMLTCKESEGSPPSNYTWYKDGTILLERPAKSSTSNNSYTVDGKTGILVNKGFWRIKSDSRDPVVVNGEDLNGCSSFHFCTLFVDEIVCFSLILHLLADDLDIGAIVITVIIIALVLSLCGLGMYYTHRKGYLGRSGSSKAKTTKQTAASPVNEEFKHTKSFVI
ncbi:junctional adhesion molecule 2A [Rhincodon typus]|uniref:junctional adhesion molecule 2A n=1 Tax=Rhincodon typus TaxID=259920 RepID=UPI00202EB027|nr:junctional adhesion molecule 2A [Rhincodon typus]